MTREEQDKIWNDLSEESKTSLITQYNSYGLNDTASVASRRTMEETFGSHNLQTKLTYEDVARELFGGKEVAFINSDGNIDGFRCIILDSASNPNICTSRKQAEKLLAINKLLNVAKFLNKNEDGSDWVPDFNNESQLWYLYIDYQSDEKGKIMIDWKKNFQSEVVYFRTKELARQAVQILGEDAVKLALTANW